MPANKRTGGIYCQRCRAANPLDQDFCARCGTRLMIVVEPTSLRYEEGAVSAGDYDAHLLERISSLENRLLRFAEKLEQGVEFLSRNARASYYDHLVLETLISMLAESGAISERRLERRWREQFERAEAESAEGARREELRAQALSAHPGPEREAFAREVSEGFALLAEGRADEGFRRLERAAALAPANAPLHTLLGEHFFRKGKATLARDYLARAHASAPRDPRVQLLLGLLYGEEGDARRAAGLLRASLDGGLPTFAAHYGLGRLSAAESDWKTAVSEFKLALAARACPEAHYTLGLAYFQTGRHRTALRHVTRALDLDEGYPEALYLLGLIRLELGEKELAAEAFEGLRRAAGGKTRRAKPRGRVRPPENAPAPALLGPARPGRKRLISGGDKRIAAALRADALDALLPK